MYLNISAVCDWVRHSIIHYSCVFNYQCIFGHNRRCFLLDCGCPAVPNKTTEFERSLRSLNGRQQFRLDSSSIWYTTMVWLGLVRKVTTILWGCVPRLSGADWGCNSGLRARPVGRMILGSWEFLSGTPIVRLPGGIRWIRDKYWLKISNKGN